MSTQPFYSIKHENHFLKNKNSHYSTNENERTKYSKDLTFTFYVTLSLILLLKENLNYIIAVDV